MTELLATIGGIAIIWFVYKAYEEWASGREARMNTPYARGVRAIEGAHAGGVRHFCFGPGSSGEHYARSIPAVAGPAPNRGGDASMLCAECAREEGWPASMGLFGAPRELRP